MNMQVKAIQNLCSVNNGYMSQILNFSEYYKSKHGLKPVQEQVINSSSSTKDGGPPQDSFFDNNKTLPAILISFLASTALTAGVHTTNILDRFGDTVKKLTQGGLTFITVVLGATAAGGYLSTLSNDSELEEKKLSYLFD
ncbi:MAG: hypothetical protein HY094_01545 [Candidatus Melainabacteria bacterium]|nr:hypothetical protein [Candidatus Melainabacteria bacterium]